MKLKSTSGSLEIKLLKRVNNLSQDYWDANWIESEIIVNIFGFNAFYKTNLRIDELEVLRNELIKLITYEKSRIEFLSAEDGLYMDCNIDSKGFIICKIKTTNEQRSVLDFKIESEISFIKEFINELESELKSFPIIGSM